MAGIYFSKIHSIMLCQILKHVFASDAKFLFSILSSMSMNLIYSLKFLIVTSYKVHIIKCFGEGFFI